MHNHQYRGAGRSHSRHFGRGPGHHFGSEFGAPMRRGPKGPGGRRRLFSGDELRLLLLKLIAERPRHGYDLIREIEEKTGGAYAPSPGVVYPTLTMLADMDLIAAQDGDAAKKTFEATDSGVAFIAERGAEADDLIARLAKISAHHARHSGGPIRRAIGNLREVIIAKMEGSDGTPDENEARAHAIAEIIDETARKIERLKLD